MRLIDKDDIFETINKNPSGNHAMRCIQLLDAINNAPTIDAVPVVRCKDCNHFIPQLRACFNNGAYMPIPWDTEKFFCAHGEARTE